MAVVYTQFGLMVRPVIASAQPPAFTENEVVNLSCDLSGNLRTSGGGGGSGGTSAVDETTFTEGVSAGTPDMGVFNDGLTGVTSGQWAVSRITAFRAHHVNLRSNNGTEFGTVGNPVNIAGSFISTPPTSNTSSAVAQTTLGTTNAQALAANSGRKGFTVQNCGLTVIKITLGAAAATQANYTFSLPACGNQNDGSSPIYSNFLWTGAVQWISSAAGGLVTIAEFT